MRMWNLRMIIAIAICICTSLTLASTLDPVLNNPQLRQAKYESLGAGTQVRQFLQNIRGKVDVNLLWEYATSNKTHPASAAAKHYAEVYGGTVLSTGLISNVFAVLQGLFLILFLLIRCLCGSCGGHRPSNEKIEDGYNGCEKLLPSCCFFILGIVAIAGGIVSALYVGNLANGLGNLKIGVAHTIGNATQFTTGVTDSLIVIDSSLDVVLHDVTVQLNGTGFVDTGVTSLLNSASTFVTATSGVTLPRGCTVVPGQTACQSCSYCTTLAGEMSGVVNGINTQVKPQLNSLASIKGVLDHNIAHMNRALLNSSIAEGADMIALLNSVNDKTITVYGEVAKQCGTATSDACATRIGTYIQYGMWIYVFLFVIALLGSIFVQCSRVVGGIMWVAWFLYALVAIGGFIISGLLIPASVVMSDGCYMIEVGVINGFDGYTTHFEASVLNSFFRDTPVLDALNLTATFDFANTFAFPAPVNFTKLLSFDGLNTLNTQVTTLDVKTSFKEFKESDIDSDLTSLNNLVDCGGSPGCPYGSNLALYPFTHSNVWDFNVDGAKNAADETAARAYFTKASDPSLDHDIIQGWLTVVGLLTIERDLQSLVTVVKSDIAELDTDIAGFQIQLSDLSSRIQRLKDTSAGDLVKAVQHLQASDCGNGNCQFVQNNYKEVSNAMCGQVMTSLFFIGIAIFAASLSICLGSPMLILMNKRLSKWQAAIHVGVDRSNTPAIS